MTTATIIIDSELLAQLDQMVAQGVFRSRSHAVEAGLREQLAHVRRMRLHEECAKLVPRQEQELADEMMCADVAVWPEY
jgi:Arc/MetJ-type ribon-helix-helix transcriptional regulator